MSAEPGETTVKTLFGVSDNHCSYTGHGPYRPCEQLLTDPSWKRVRARICHIEGEHQGSARYRANMTDEERRHFDNLILLCPNCHNLIDELDPDLHTVDILRDMKAKSSQADRPKWYGSEERLAHLVQTALAVYRQEQASAAQGHDHRHDLSDKVRVFLEQSENYKEQPKGADLVVQNVTGKDLDRIKFVSRGGRGYAPTFTMRRELALAPDESGILSEVDLEEAFAYSPMHFGVRVNSDQTIYYQLVVVQAGPSPDGDTYYRGEVQRMADVAPDPGASDRFG